jgi:hypothetical protein
MELAVGGRKGLGVLRRLGRHLHDLLTPRPSPDRGIGDAEFDDLPPEQGAQRPLATIGPGVRPRHLLDHERAIALPLDEPDGDQALDRLANRRARHSELLGEDALGRERRAGVQVAGQDPAVDLLPHPFGDRAAFQWLEGAPGHFAPHSRRTVEYVP